MTFAPSAEFIWGDCNASGVVSIVDALFLLEWIFAGGKVPLCESACDYDDNGAPALVDALGILVFLFLGGEEPAAPYPDPGTDPTLDGLDCAE